MNKDRPARGISLRILNYLTSGVTLAISVLLLISTCLTSKRYDAVRASTDDYLLWSESAGDMLAGSDYLTDQARLFAFKGDRTHLDNYFTEAKETNRRDKALETIESHLGGTEAFDRLQTAMNESMDLMNTEYYSMRLIVESLHDPVGNYPEEVRGVVLTAEDLALTDEQKAGKALEILVNDDYENSKKIIRDGTQSCIDALNAAMKARLSGAIDELNGTLLLEQWLIVILVAVVVLSLILTTLQVIRPLLKAVPHIRDEEPLPVSGAYEYRYLAKTYNKMYEASSKHKKMLSYEANHDKLTGLFNRSGYLQFAATADLSSCAFLIIDVDDFKMINDTYGHTAGDKALTALSEELRRNFRSGDCLCRIGGDEFVVILTRISKDVVHFKEKINDKIKHINEVLLLPDGERPSMTVSAGASIGHSEARADELFEKADEALYHVKKSGKRACRFYE